MDVNLTYPIAANVTLVQPWWNPWITAGIPALGAILGAIAGGSATYFIQRLLIKNSQLEKRKQTYSKLKGLKDLLGQVYYAFFAATVIYKKRCFQLKSQESIYQPRNEKVNEWFTLIAKTRKEFAEYERDLYESPISQEIGLEKDKKEKYALKLAQLKKQLWEIIGLIQVSFDNTDRLDKLITNIEEVLDKGDGLIKDPLEGSNLNLVDEWGKNALNIEIPNYLDKELHSAIENLCDYLKDEINKESKEHWWHRW